MREGEKFIKCEESSSLVWGEAKCRSKITREVRIDRRKRF